VRVVVLGVTRHLGALVPECSCVLPGMRLSVRLPPSSLSHTNQHIHGTLSSPQEQLVSTLTQFPDAQERLAQQAEILFVRHIRCYLCNKTGHISIGCR